MQKTGYWRLQGAIHFDCKKDGGIGLNSVICTLFVHVSSITTHSIRGFARGVLEDSWMEFGVEAYCMILFMFRNLFFSSMRMEKRNKTGHNPIGIVNKPGSFVK